ncbi:Trans-enoyl reductase pgmF [Exophiala dermatitidis]
MASATSAPTTATPPSAPSSTSIPIPSTMRAWQYTHTHGGIEKNLTLTDSAALPPHDAKSLGHNKVLVQVLAAALNPVDYKLAEAPVLSRLAIKKPASPGLDFAGRVVAVGTGEGSAHHHHHHQKHQDQHAALTPSTLVFGRIDPPTQYGTLAEYTIAHTDAVAVLPEGVDPRDAAGVGTAGLTAYQSIVPYVRKEKTEGQDQQQQRPHRVFINGGSGGTGTWGIQIAKTLGCYVVTSCSGRNVELCKSLGADEVVDYTSEDVVEALKKKATAAAVTPSEDGGSRSEDARFDLVIDNVGSPAALYWRCHEFTTPKAKFVHVGADMSLHSGLEITKRLLWPGFLGGGKRAYHFIATRNDAAQLEEIGKWLKEGKIRAVNDEVFSMEDVPKAFERLKTKHAKGKIVVAVRSE